MKKKYVTQSLFVILFTVSCLFAEKGNDAVKQKQYTAKDFSYLIGMEGFTKDQLAMHFKLYEGYVKNTNQLGKMLQELIDNGNERSPQYAGLKRMYGWEYDGMRLHEKYFGNLGGSGELNPDSDLYKTIVSHFGSYENWKKNFVDTGMIRGIGWVILYQDPETGKLTNAWVSEHDAGHLAGNNPLIVMDVWEHAYITVYGLKRDDYIAAFFGNINWDVVKDRFSERKVH